MDREHARIAVVGMGAIGSSVAADLLDLGHHEVIQCTRTPHDALRVDHPAGSSLHAGSPLVEPSEAQPADWVLLCTKAHQTEAARGWLENLCVPGTRVAVLQNGIDHVERIRPLLPCPAPIVPVVVQLPAEKLAPGHVHQGLAGALIVADDQNARDFAALFTGARVHLKNTDDFITQAWWKLLANAALGGVCALALCENGAALEPTTRALVLDLMEEVAAVGRADGAALAVDAPQKAIDLLVGAAPTHWSSIAVDRREGRAMEWQARNAIVGERGRALGVPTPLNDAVTALLQAADQAMLNAETPER